MGKSNYASNGILNLIFQSVAWANIAQNAASPLTTVYIALHTGDPTAGGNQSANECTYSGYARVAVPRSSVGWATSTVQSTSPQAAITFPPGTGGSGTVTFFSIGDAATGPGNIFYSGPVTPTLGTGNGITPQLTTGTTITES